MCYEQLKIAHYAFHSWSLSHCPFAHSAIRVLFYRASNNKINPFYNGGIMASLKKQSADAAAAALAAAGELITALHTLTPSLIELGDADCGGMFCDDDVAGVAGALLRRIDFLNNVTATFQIQAGTVNQVAGHVKTLTMVSKEMKDDKAGEVLDG